MVLLRWLICASLVVATLDATPVSQIRPAEGLTRQTWTIDGVERSALISTPKGAVPEKGAPVVLVFHGHGGSSAQAARSFRIHTAWPEAVVMYPQGLPTRGQITDPEGQRPGWQHTPGGEGDRDLKLVDAMLDWVAARHRIDPARIFSAGHSNGGTMVYVLWAARGDRFAAFAPSSSVFRADAIKRARPRPAFIVAGREDALVPFAAQQLSLSGVLKLNQAAVAGAAWEGPARLHSSSNGADVVTYIHPGGHALPNDAGALMVRFFKGAALYNHASPRWP